MGRRDLSTSIPIQSVIFHRLAERPSLPSLLRRRQMTMSVTLGVFIYEGTAYNLPLGQEVAVFTTSKVFGAWFGRSKLIHSIPQ